MSIKHSHNLYGRLLPNRWYYLWARNGADGEAVEISLLLECLRPDARPGFVYQGAFRTADDGSIVSMQRVGDVFSLCDPLPKS